MKILSALLFTALSAVLALGQDAKAKVTPPEVEAGKPITITLTLDKKATEGTNVRVDLGPKEGTAILTVLNLSATSDPLVYKITAPIPVNAKGLWEVKGAFFFVPQDVNAIPLEIDKPEFTVKPSGIALPTSGTVKVMVP